MPAFPKPSVEYEYDVGTQVDALRNYSKQAGKEDRAIPSKQGNRLLLATWNIVNLGVQKRRDKDHRLIAEILCWFRPRRGPGGQ
jgi:hypothetical protein